MGFGVSGSLTTSLADTTISMDDIILDSATTLCTNTSAGATVGGSQSDQKFSKINLDLEDEITVIELQMVGFYK